MQTISLSIEELVYCFFSEGYFEQGNAIKQLYFGEIGEEKTEVLLQAANRSLLSKDLLIYQNHKFSLIEELKNIMITLNSANQTIRASKHGDDSDEIAISYHLGNFGIIRQTTKYEEQVHVFDYIKMQELQEDLKQFYCIDPVFEDNGNTLSLTEAEFEELLSVFDDNEKLFNPPVYTGVKQQFFKNLIETHGLLNTLMFISYNQKNDPVVDNIIMFTNRNNANWQIEKRENIFEIKMSSSSRLGELLNKNLQLETV